MHGRHAAPFIRDVLARFRRQALPARAAAAELGISRSRFYCLYADYLRACATHTQRHWQPRSSGGNRFPQWPALVLALLRKLLSADPPASYSFAASEVHRRHALKLDRATVRRWALLQKLAPDTAHKKRPKPVRRWQVQQIGQLWQYDASPHRWFARQPQQPPLLELLDDHSRLLPLARLYPRESLLAHLDFLSSAFATCGLPLALYVDYHSFFFTSQPDAFTQLGAALRLPRSLAALRPHSPGQRQNRARARLLAKTSPGPLRRRTHHHSRGSQPPHRSAPPAPQHPRKTPRDRLHPASRLGPGAQRKSLGLTPAAALSLVPYVWSVRSQTRVGPDGRVALAAQRLRVEQPPHTRVIRCLHPNGDHSLLLHPPVKGKLPLLLLHCPAPA